MVNAPDRLLAEAGIASGRTELAEAMLAAGSAARDLLSPSLHARSDAPPVWWMRGALDAPDIRARLGRPASGEDEVDARSGPSAATA